jgi:tetratricopeptide (TPR) repeat protein
MSRVCCVALVLVASAAFSSTPRGVESQVAVQRRAQIESLKKIIELSPDQDEMPLLLFRLGELYREEAQFHEFEANRKEDALAQEKAELLARSKEFGKLAIAQYTKLITQYPSFERNDEVLFYLGHFLMEEGQDKKALVVYKRLVEKYPKSRFLPDTWLAFGEYFFNNSKGQRPELERALEAYQRAAEFTESQVYPFALYKQGWCYFNLGNYALAKEKFKAVVLYGELAGGAMERTGGRNKWSALMKEARNDYVRAYAREGDVAAAKEDFSKVATHPEDRFTMMTQLGRWRPPAPSSRRRTEGFWTRPTRWPSVPCPTSPSPGTTRHARRVMRRRSSTRTPSPATISCSSRTAPRPRSCASSATSSAESSRPNPVRPPWRPHNPCPPNQTRRVMRASTSR